LVCSFKIPEQSPINYLLITKIEDVLCGFGQLSSSCFLHWRLHCIHGRPPLLGVTDHHTTCDLCRSTKTFDWKSDSKESIRKGKWILSFSAFFSYASDHFCQFNEHENQSVDGGGIGGHLKSPPEPRSTAIAYTPSFFEPYRFLRASSGVASAVGMRTHPS